VHPTVVIACSGEALVKDIEVEKPAAMHESAVSINVRRATVSPLDDGNPIPKVADITEALGIGHLADWCDMQIVAIRLTHHTSSALEVAAEGVALTIRIASRGLNMVPAIGSHNRGQPFIKAECPLKSARIGGLSIRMDVPRLPVTANWSEAWRVKL